MIEDVYSQIVHWRPNLFGVSSGSARKLFMAELAHLFEAFESEYALESIGIALTALPALMPHAKSKVQEHVACLDGKWEI